MDRFEAVDRDSVCPGTNIRSCEKISKTWAEVPQGSCGYGRTFWLEQESEEQQHECVDESCFSGFGPGVDILRETSPYKEPRAQPPGRTNTRMRKVV